MNSIIFFGVVLFVHFCFYFLTMFEVGKGYITDIVRFEGKEHQTVKKR
jgi:hypothetical protein